MDNYFDIIIVGAGPQGLAAAKTYLQCSPSTNLLILDRNESVGGVWAKEKLYDGLRSNNLRGTFEFTDLPMDDSFGVKAGEHVPGTVLHEYFVQYAKRFDLTRRIRFRTTVEAATEVDGRWELTVYESATDSTHRGPSPLPVSYKLVADKLIIATGAASTPTPIAISNAPAFQRPIINFASIARSAPALLNDPTAARIAVYGGSKAAYDAVYLFASAGKQITWIISASGHGPIFMARPHVRLGPLPLQLWLEKVTAMRPFTFLSPCIWGDADGFGWIRYLLHGTSGGRWLVRKIWGFLSEDLLAQSGINDKGPEVAKLRPEHNVLWHATGLAILNYPTDIHDFVRSGQVQIVRKDIQGLSSEGTITFTDSSAIQADALVMSSGWQFAPTIALSPKENLSAWGIPSTTLTREQQSRWADLHAHADVEILTRFPILLDGPPPASNDLVATRTDVFADAKSSTSGDGRGEEEKAPAEYTPWRLWRGIAPPSQVLDPSRRNLVFLGMALSIQGMLRAEISSLWAYAYLTDRLPRDLRPLSVDATEALLPSSSSSRSSSAEEREEAIFRDAALFGRFGKWRTPCGFGARFPDLAFDGIPYFDLLLGDLGMRTWRKGWGVVGELFGGGYAQAEYRGLVEEWLGRKG